MTKSLSIKTTDKIQHVIKPPLSMAKQAAAGLKLHNQFKRGGTEVGLKRARDLKEQKELTATDIKKIYSYFARHTVDKQSAMFTDKENPSNGYIAWLLWGGDAGEKWINKERKKLEF